MIGNRAREPRPLRAAVIGYGLSGRYFHAPFIRAREDFDLTAVVTSSVDRAATARSDNGAIAIHASVDDLFRSSRTFDVVVIATNVDSHASLAHRAIQAGKHVVLDKPFTLTAKAAKKLGYSAMRAGVVISAYQNRRWDADFLALQKLISEGLLGAVLRFESSFEWSSPDMSDKWRDVAPPAQGGGLMYELGPHLIDQAVHLFGPVLSVHMELDTRRPAAIADDDTFLALRHAGNVSSRLWMSQVSRSTRPRLRVEGSRGAFISYGLDPQETQLLDGMTPQDPLFGSRERWYGRVLTDDGETEIDFRPESYGRFYELFGRAVRGRGLPPVSIADTIEVMRIVERGRIQRMPARDRSSPLRHPVSWTPSPQTRIGRG